MILVMKNKLSTTLAQYWQTFPWAGYLVLFLTVMGALRYFNLNDLLDWSLQTVLLLIGGLLSTIVFTFEHQLNHLIDKAGAWLAHEELNPQDETVAEPLSRQHSWLRSNVVLITLPVLAFYLLTSSHLAIGFGFLLGLSSIYLMDIWKFTQGKMPQFLQVYFYRQPTPSYVRTLIMGYSLYYIAFCFALILL